MALCNFFGLYESAELCANELAKYYSSNLPAYSNSDSWLHEGLAALIMCGQQKQHSRRRMKIAKERIKKLQLLSDYSPENYANKVSLLQAELAVVNGNPGKAMAKFDESIRLAKESRRYWDIGLASERAAALMKRNGQHQMAKEYFDAAIGAYSDWGATAKVEQLADKRRLEEGA